MSDYLSITFQALADPTRRAILAQLSKGDANVSDLAKPFLKKMSLPGFSKHLKVLEKAGLITKTADAQFRSCQLNTLPLEKANHWMEQYRQMWEESFDRLDDYLKVLQSAKMNKGIKNGKSKK